MKKITSVFRKNLRAAITLRGWLQTESSGFLKTVKVFFLGIVAIVGALNISGCTRSEADDKRIAARMAVEMCEDSLKKENDEGVKEIIAGSCKLLQNRYEAEKGRNALRKVPLPSPTHVATIQEWNDALRSTYKEIQTRDKGDGIAGFMANFYRENDLKRSLTFFGERDAFRKLRFFTEAGVKLEGQFCPNVNSYPEFCIKRAKIAVSG